MNLKNKKVYVLGLGISGFAAAKLLISKGAQTFIYDNFKKNNKDCQELEKLGAKIEFGQLDEKSFLSSDLIVTSPGISYTSSEILLAKQHKIKVIAEIELASRFIKEPIIGITGTNGKSTTCRMIDFILSKCGYKSFLGGNIGVALSDYPLMKKKCDFLVVELSSFQLETIENFKPKIAICLNFTSDHLDRYNNNFENYVNAKARIFKNQKEDDFAIINFQDNISFNIKGEKIYFNKKNKFLDIKEDKIIFHNGDSINIKNTNLIGKHNLLNLAAASCACMQLGIEASFIKKYIKDFLISEHTIEFVRKIDGKSFYNDSKGTNSDACLKALNSFEKNIILLMGGRKKDNSFGILKEKIKKHVKALILFGEARNEIKKELGNITITKETKTLKEAVLVANDIGKDDDIILLSPACSSFDAYKSYKDRGNDFKNTVNNL